MHRSGTLPIRVAIVDDDREVCASLDRLFSLHGGLEVVECINELAGAQERLRLAAPDVVLLDLGMPGGNPLDLIARVRRDRADCRVVVLSGTITSQAAHASLDAGAAGYVDKFDSTKELIRHVFDAAGGRVVMSRSVREVVVRPRPGLPQNFPD